MGRSLALSCSRQCATRRWHKANASFTGDSGTTVRNQFIPTHMVTRLFVPQDATRAKHMHQVRHARRRPLAR